MKSTYYIALHTRQAYDPEEYVSEAGKMTNALQLVFGDKEKIRAITKGEPLTSCHSEVEVSHENGELVGKCVLDMVSSKRVQLDKSKLSMFLKSSTNWPNAKIEKRAVTAEINA